MVRGCKWRPGESRRLVDSSCGAFLPTFQFRRRLRSWTHRAARQEVRDQVAHDADLIKVCAAYDFSFFPDGRMIVPPTFTAEEINAIVDEAHPKGRKVACHAFG